MWCAYSFDYFTSLTYHFLQRPLELIFWDRYDTINNEEKNFKTMKTVITPTFANT
ncbi:TPA: hypothetical protein ACYKK1_000359 [Campylobacter jejuni]